MSDRVLTRRGARELTPEESEQIAGAQTIGCKGTTLHTGGPVVDTFCDAS